MAISLKSVLRTGSSLTPRTVLYGVEGIGKSTFGASAPNPIFIQTEDGLSAISVDAFPLCRTWQDIMDCMRSLSEEAHEYQTVVLDSADWTENIIMGQVAADNGLDKFDTNSKQLAYGRGNRAIAEYWRILIDCFDCLRDEKKMGVIILAHSQVKRFDDPTTDSYDRYILDLNKESASILSEWCDVLAFTNYKTSVKEEVVGIGGKKKRGLGSGERFLFTQEKPAYKAKSRWTIPPELPLDYDQYAAAITAAMA